ncbi:MAG: glycosyltransferase family 4 protein [Deltaproteobacteria bacterium]|nr:glycosyltransferase family 4 protein [Deltaproteobacteria bacterium]
MRPRSSLRLAMVAPPCLPVPPRGYGGTELVIAELVDGLSALGVEVTLFAAPGSRGGFQGRCEVVSPLSRAIWPPRVDAEVLHCRRAAALIARDGRFDLVHAHCPAMADFAHWLGAPLVLSVHHALGRDGASPRVHHAFVSQSQREQWSRSARGEVIHHGLSARRYPLGRGDGGYAAFLGRFSAQKGLHHAIDASARAGLELHAAGSMHPEDRTYFAAELAKRLRLPHVRALGEVDHAGKLALLRGAVALCFPIAWEEPFGLAMLEAMLCGTPVLAFPRGAAVEVVDDGVTGFLVDSPRELAHALKRLAVHGFDRLRCREQAMARFGRDAMVARHLALYTRALETARTRSILAQP